MRGRAAARLAALGAGSVAATVGYQAAFGQRTQWFGDFPYRIRPGAADPPQVAITFDDGPNEPYTSRLLDLLGERGVPATFFQVGRCAERFPSTTRRVVAEGHQLGNHSFSHEFTRYLTAPRQREEIARAQQVLSSVAGVQPAFYRPPWLCHWPWVLSSIRHAGLQVTSGQFCHPLEVFQPEAATIARAAHKLARPGNIVIFHDGFDARGGRRDQSVAGAIQLVDRLLADGVRLVTVAQLFDRDPYLEPARARSDGRSKGPGSDPTA